MKKLALVALTALSSSAMAWEPEFYAGAGLSSWQFKQSNIPTNVSLFSIEAVGGIKVFEYLNVEARVGAGLNEGRDDFTVIVDDMGDADPLNDVLARDVIQIEMDYYTSIYIRPELRNEKASLYGLLGYTFSQFSGDSISPDEDSDTQDDLSFGLGVSFVFDEKTNVTLEWKKLINADDFDMRGATVGFSYDF